MNRTIDSNSVNDEPARVSSRSLMVISSRTQNCVVRYTVQAQKEKKRMMWGYWTTVHGLVSASEISTFLFIWYIINFATQQYIILEISHAHIMSKLLRDCTSM